MHGAVRVNEESCLKLFLKIDTSKNDVKEISWTLHKQHRQFSKRVLFLKIPWWQQKHVCELKPGKLLNSFFYNVVKTCLFGMKIYEILKSSISFILKHIFMCLTSFIEAAYVPLKEKNKGYLHQINSN